jgi:hypothetical protein
MSSAAAGWIPAFAGMTTPADENVSRTCFTYLLNQGEAKAAVAP